MNVFKVINFLINLCGVTSTNTCARCFFPEATSLFCHVHHFQGCTTQALTEQLSFGFPSGAVALGPNILWSTPPSKESP